jgi:hypothetical protein
MGLTINSQMEIKYAVVKFHESSKEYTYRTDLDLEKGDLVVVSSPHSGYAVVTVIDVSGLTQSQRSMATKWIVQKVDITEHLARLERQKLAQEIRNKLQSKKEQVEELLIYKRLAESDPSINALLKQLEELEGAPMLTNKAHAK